MQGAANAAAAAANSATTGLQGLFGSTTGAPPEPPGKAIETRYAALINFVGKGPGDPIDNVLKLLNDLQLQLSKLAGAPSAGTAAAIGGGETRPRCCRPRQAAIRRRLVAGSRHLRSPATSCAAAARRIGEKGIQRAGRARITVQTGSRWPLPVHPRVENRHPLDDFARLFTTGGLLDKYFADNLASFVDTSGPVWKTQAVAGVAPPVTPADLAQFQRASQIRDLFFAGGGNQPTVRFDITPMDTDAKQVTLDLDGLSVVYAHGPQRSTSVALARSESF